MTFISRHMDHYEVETFMDGSIMTIADAPWPGFTPDLISIVLVVATQAKGSVLIHQKMFESRLFFVDKLIDMGAKIILCDPHRATVIGLDRQYPLRGIRMSSPDIRAGVPCSLQHFRPKAKASSTTSNRSTGATRISIPGFRTGRRYQQDLILTFCLVSRHLAGFLINRLNIVL